MWRTDQKSILVTDKLKKLNCNTIIPVILAGGVGKRLWPLSRKIFPNNLVKFLLSTHFSRNNKKASIYLQN